jgi:uncharacterized protein (TIGR03083 family)
MTVDYAVTASSSTRKPLIERGLAMRLAATEYERFASAVEQLSASDWRAATACPDWDVHAVACHVLGMAEYAASMPEKVKQTIGARRVGGLFIDALTALQVDKHRHRPRAELVQRLSAIAPRAAAGRRRTPGLARRIPLTGQPVDEKGTITEKWSLGYLTDVILTRDTWMHRSDIADATNTAMTLTAEHDGVLVSDVAAEWGMRHQQPCTLTLTGPAGGSWTFNGASAHDRLYELDAVAFCRIVSGRGHGEGLLATRVPF